jgi:hypothetical protein
MSAQQQAGQTSKAKSSEDLVAAQNQPQVLRPATTLRGGRYGSQAHSMHSAQQQQLLWESLMQQQLAWQHHYNQQRQSALVQVGHLQGQEEENMFTATQMNRDILPQRPAVLQGVHGDNQMPAALSGNLAYLSTELASSAPDTSHRRGQEQIPEPELEAKCPNQLQNEAKQGQQIEE